MRLLESEDATMSRCPVLLPKGSQSRSTSYGILTEIGIYTDKNSSRASEIVYKIKQRSFDAATLTMMWLDGLALRFPSRAEFSPISAQWGYSDSLRQPNSTWARINPRSFNLRLNLQYLWQSRACWRTRVTRETGWKATRHCAHSLKSG